MSAAASRLNDPRTILLAGGLVGGVAGIVAGALLHDWAAATQWVTLPFIVAFLAGVVGVVSQQEQPWAEFGWAMRLTLFSTAALAVALAAAPLTAVLARG